MDPSADRVRPLAEALTAEEVEALVAEARVEARERVRAALVEAMTESLLDRIGTAAAARDVGKPQEAHPSEDDGELAWYVYGVIGAEELDLPADVTGIEQPHAIGTVREGGLAAVASPVSGTEFAEAQLRAHLADMDWVQRVAQAHEAVLDEIARRATVVPMRMCTVYRTESGVQEMLQREAGGLREALGHLNGKTEWGVKVLADPSRAAAGMATQTYRELQTHSEGAGAAYMGRKRQEREQAEQAAEQLEHACAEIHESLCAIAADALIAPPQRPEAHGLSGEMVLNGIYLVRDDDQAAFHDRIEALAEQYGSLGFELVRTGPWPAYNFVPDTLGATW